MRIKKTILILCLIPVFYLCFLNKAFNQICDPLPVTEIFIDVDTWPYNIDVNDDLVAFHLGCESNDFTITGGVINYTLACENTFFDVYINYITTNNPEATHLLVLKHAAPDSDINGIIDFCEFEDADGDGVPNEEDDCPCISDALDLDGDGIKDCTQGQTSGDEPLPLALIPPEWIAPNGKIYVWKIPPGNPENAHQITVNYNALSSHLLNGSILGFADCGDGEIAERQVQNAYSSFIQVFPNPAADHISFNVGKLSGKPGIVQIHNSQGILINEMQFQSLPSEPIQVLIQDYSSGLYTISVKADKRKLETTRFVVNRL